MKKISIVDMTIRESAEKSGYAMSFKEKLEVAKQMEKLRVDVIELPSIIDEKTDLLLIKTIASVIKKSVLSCAVGLDEAEADLIWNAVKNAAKPRLNIVVPTSPIQMEYVCGKKPKKVLELVEQVVTHCTSMCSDVEFTAVDATRSEEDFLAQILETAVRCGAKTITLCDTAGVMMPEEFKVFLDDMINKVPNLKDVNISVECRDDIKMSNANAMAAITTYASQVKTTILGVDLPSIESIVHTIKCIGDRHGISCEVKSTELLRAINQLSWLKGHSNSSISLFDNGDSASDNDNIELSADADISEVSEIIKRLGYDLNPEDVSKVYEEYMRVVSKKVVGVKELEAIIAATALQVPPTYKLEEFVITSGNIIAPIANVTLAKNNKKLVGLSNGDGPIEAAFLAIEQILGHHYELDDFQIQAVTEGSEAVGSAIVKLRNEGTLYSGSGISTDIIGASIRAYLSAINKIVYEGEE